MRRRDLYTLAVTAPAAIAITKGANLLLPIKEPAPPLYVETKDANFAFLFGKHGHQEIGQALHLPNDKGKVHALYLETGQFPYLLPYSRRFLFPSELKGWTF